MDFKEALKNPKKIIFSLKESSNECVTFTC